MKVNEESEKLLETQYEKTKIMATAPITSWQKNSASSDRFYFLVLQNHCEQ